MPRRIFTNDMSALRYAGRQLQSGDGQWTFRNVTPKRAKKWLRGGAFRNIADPSDAALSALSRRLGVFLDATAQGGAIDLEGGESILTSMSCAGSKKGFMLYIFDFHQKEDDVNSERQLYSASEDVELGWPAV